MILQFISLLTVNMSITLEFSGNTSHLIGEYFPPIELPTSYECGLVSLYTYNSIPNVTSRNNRFKIGPHEITLPAGSYEFSDIVDCIMKKLEKLSPKVELSITPNFNTLQVEIKASDKITFFKGTIGEIFGFSNQTIQARKLAKSDLPIKISSVTSIRVECNIITASYMNNEPVHILHTFSPDVEIGYKISEVPHNIIYMPVNTKTIREVDIKLIDQDNNLIDFRNENIVIRLHLRPRI